MMVEPIPGQWCKWQTLCEEDLTEGSWTCLARLDDIGAVRCPYNCPEAARAAPCDDYEDMPEEPGVVVVQTPEELN